MWAEGHSVDEWWARAGTGRADSVDPGSVQGAAAAQFFDLSGVEAEDLLEHVVVVLADEEAGSTGCCVGLADPQPAVLDPHRSEHGMRGRDEVASGDELRVAANIVRAQHPMGGDPGGLQGALDLVLGAR